MCFIAWVLSMRHYKGMYASPQNLCNTLTDLLCRMHPKVVWLQPSKNRQIVIERFVKNWKSIFFFYKFTFFFSWIKKKIYKINVIYFSRNIQKWIKILEILLNKFYYSLEKKCCLKGRNFHILLLKIVCAKNKTEIPFN